MSIFHEDYRNLRELLAKNHHHFASQMPTNAENAHCMAGSGSGDNYMSIVKRIRIQTTKSDFDSNSATGTSNRTKSSTSTTISLIVKRQVSDEKRRELFRFVEIFSNEILAYNVIVPYIQKHLPLADNLIFPECYYAGHDQAKELIIILEDLSEIGFRLYDRQIDMDLDVCKAVVMQLARLHAASLIASVRDTEGFDSLRGNLFDVVYSEKAEELYSKLLRSSLAIALSSLELSNKDGSLTEPIGQLELLHGKVFKCMRQCVLRADKVHSVICHGDLWVNNIMVNGATKPPSIKFVDLQALRYGSPVFDILHVIYTGTRRELRDQHTKDILETYCTTLAGFLEQMLPHKVKAMEALKDLYSLRNITDQYNRSLAYGLGVSMWILPACTFDPDNLPDLDNISGSPPNGEGQILQAIQAKLTDRYHVRMKETVLEFHENGYLKSLIDELESFDDANAKESKTDDKCTTLGS